MTRDLPNLPIQTICEIAEMSKMRFRDRKNDRFGDRKKVLDSLFILIGGSLESP